MAFRVSSHQKNGQRTASVLIEGGQAVISDSKSADLQFSLPANSSVTISESSGHLTIKADGLEISVKGKPLKDDSVKVGTSAQFKYGESEFYTTVVLTGEPTARKKSVLSTVALTLIWTLLAVMVITPLWLPYKITSHKVKGRNVIMENCSSGLDNLRRKVKETQKNTESLSQTHRDILVKISEEVEQIAWVFRNVGELMSKSELEKLENDIDLYFKILNKVKKTDSVVVKPLTTESAVQKMLDSQK